MIIHNFPNCCTAKVLSGFGGTLTSFENRGGREPSVQDVKAELGEVLNSPTHLAMYTAVTNSEQVNTSKALEEVGFLSSDWMEKDAHPETKVKLWWYPIKHKQING